MSKESKLVILRREFLHLCQGNFCAAKLIEYFKNWTSWKTQAQRTPWIYQPLKRIHADLMGEHSLHVIRGAMPLATTSWYRIPRKHQRYQ